VSPEARLSDDRDVGMRAEYASEPRRSAARHADDEVDLDPRTVRLRDATSHAGSAVQRSAARAPDLNASSIDRYSQMPNRPASKTLCSRNVRMMSENGPRPGARWTT